MGADGHIRIWRRTDVEEVFPDCQELFGLLPTHYLDELDGVKYDHCYWGDNLYDHWTEYYESSLKGDVEKTKRMEEFIHWLETHGTHWEVWT